MFIQGIGVAVPPRAYSQEEVLVALSASRQFGGLKPASRELLRRVLSGSSGIRRRHFTFDNLAEAFDISPQAQHDRFETHAPALAAAAGRDALGRSGCGAAEIDAVLVSTCTGSLCPGLSSHLVDLLGLRRDVLGLDLVGQGCGAALPNLSTAAALLRGGGAARVLSICVEICSAAMFLDDDAGVLISACLFADGAAAAVLGRDPGEKSGRIEWINGISLTAPEERETLRFERREGCLRNILRPRVPDLAAGSVRALLDEACGSAGLARGEITEFILHPGGKKVLDAAALGLGLPTAALRWSREVLDAHGNMSSPSVWFVLKHALEGDSTPGWWWMSSFGAGFTCHGALLRVAPGPE